MLAGAQPIVDFGGDLTVSGTTGCNRFTGGYTTSGSALAVGQVAMTMMACTGPGVMEQETAFTQALAATPSAATLRRSRVLDKSGRVLLVLTQLLPVPETPLLGTTWKLSGIVANEAVSSPVAGYDVTLVLTDGALTGKACNTFRGQAAITGTTIKVGPLMSTKMACANEAATAQETAVLMILEAATTLTQEGATLTLTAADGKALQFTAA
ncbi:MAG: META domain-containing protein [Propionibacteriaceae bacterium]|nr:META domain-containing protein [Propionibacteriaceae bacterium]